MERDYMERKLAGNRSVALLFPQDTEAQSQVSPATKSQRQREREEQKGEKKQAAACSTPLSLSTCSLSWFFFPSRFSLVNWILSGALGCAPSRTDSFTPTYLSIPITK
jgi:hypothetical protein